MRYLSTVLFSLKSELLSHNSVDSKHNTIEQGMTKYLITGASRGIRLELVRQLLARDTTEFVFAASRSGSKQLEELANHPKLKLVELDVSDEETIKKAAEKLKPYKINVLVNNAGVNASGSSLTTTSEGALEAFRINVVGPLLVTKYFLPLLETDTAKPAIIANISSFLSSLKEATNSDYQFFDNVPYRVSKAALNMLTRLQSLELKDKNIAVVSFSPGWVSTDMGGPTAPVTPKNQRIGQSLNRRHWKVFGLYRSRTSIVMFAKR